MNSRARAGLQIIGMILGLTVLYTGPAAADQSIVADLPRGYVGEFNWYDDPASQTVVIKFKSVRALGRDAVEATGCGVYDAGGQITKIRVRMLVRLSNLLVTIWELAPTGGSRTFETDGSHTGYLSDDLQAIEAEWTTRSTGKQGRLHLHAAPDVECEPLRQSKGDLSRAATQILIGGRKD